MTVQSIEQAEAFGKQTGESYEITEKEADIIAGTPNDVKEILEQLHKKYQVDEFILHTPIEKEVERLRSFQLLSPICLNGNFGRKITENEVIYREIVGTNDEV